MKTKLLILSLSTALALNAADSDTNISQTLDNINNSVKTKFNDMKEHAKGMFASSSDEIKSEMHKEMKDKGMQFDKKVENDYLTNMIPHHQGAIDSSKSLLKYSKDDHVRKIAQNIIDHQEKEIKEFKEILDDKNFKTTKLSEQEYSNFVKEQKQTMEIMMKNMMSVKNSGNVDKDYLEAMIPHHQGAIDSSKSLLKYSKDDHVRKIAQNIIDHQEKEIKEFKEILKSK